MSFSWSDTAVKPFLTNLIRETRPTQWYKQLVIFIPVIFALSAFEPTAWIRTGMGAVVFSGIAGSIYITNDILDIEEDRNHPKKQHRPIASGQLGVPVAISAAIVLSVGGLAVAWGLSPMFFIVLLIYIGQNLLYSLWLKQFFLIDIFIVGVGFVLRAISGIVLIDTTLSPWMFLSVFLAALMLAVGKRRGELTRIDNADEVRDSLDQYTIQFLDFILFGISTTLLVAYSLYTFFVREIVMMLTIPFAFYAVFKYVYNILENEIEQPGDTIFELPMIINFILWAGVVIFALYLYPSFQW